MQVILINSFYKQQKEDLLKVGQKKGKNLTVLHIIFSFIISVICESWTFSLKSLGFNLSLESNKKHILWSVSWTSFSKIDLARKRMKFLRFYFFAYTIVDEHLVIVWCKMSCFSFLTCKKAQPYFNSMCCFIDEPK